MDKIVVIDFETTGLSPAQGARAIEVGAVRICGDIITDEFQSLINPGFRIPPDIEKLTGIQNEMIINALPAKNVMPRLNQFIGDSLLVAHNARFDKSFLDNEYTLAGISKSTKFACTLKISKLIYPNSPNHKLQTLLDYADIQHKGNLHRALFDAFATANLWIQMKRDICSRYNLSNLSHKQMAEFTNATIKSLSKDLGNS